MLVDEGGKMAPTDCIEELVASFEVTLKTVGASLEAALGERATWGIAGLGEAPHVFLLAETMRKLGWPTVLYERPYSEYCRDGEPLGQTRSDILAKGRDGHAPVVIEAKWWWNNRKLSAILDLDKDKLDAVKDEYIRLAVVFSVSAPDEEREQDRWRSPEHVRQWFEKQVPIEWRLRGCAVAKSPYFYRKAHPEGLFAGAFIQRLSA